MAGFRMPVRTIRFVIRVSECPDYYRFYVSDHYDMNKLSTSWTPAADGVDPALVPHRILAGGVRMPAIGLGTFGSDHVSPGAVAEAVKSAAAVGYRHFDCASVYGNERQAGLAFQEIVGGGVSREQLWVT